MGFEPVIIRTQGVHQTYMPHVFMSSFVLAALRILHIALQRGILSSDDIPSNCYTDVYVLQRIHAYTDVRIDCTD